MLMLLLLLLMDGHIELVEIIVLLINEHVTLNQWIRSDWVRLVNWILYIIIVLTIDYVVEILRVDLMLRDQTRL